MKDRHEELMERIAMAVHALHLQSEENKHQFDLFFDIEKMTEFLDYLEEFDTEIQNEADDPK